MRCLLFVGMELISYQDKENALDRVDELQNMPELDVVEQMELDRLIREINEFKEKLINLD